MHTALIYSFLLFFAIKTLAADICNFLTKYCIIIEYPVFRITPLTLLKIRPFFILLFKCTLSISKIRTFSFCSSIVLASNMCILLVLCFYEFKRKKPATLNFVFFSKFCTQLGCINCLDISFCSFQDRKLFAVLSYTIAK